MLLDGERRVGWVGGGITLSCVASQKTLDNFQTHTSAFQYRDFEQLSLLPRFDPLTSYRALQGHSDVVEVTGGEVGGALERLGDMSRFLGCIRHSFWIVVL